MCAMGDAEFLRILKKDIAYYEGAIERFEDVIPYVSSAIQDQWRLQAQVRRNFAMELEILYLKAEACVDATLESEINNWQSDSASR
jgi:hypothetical protein